MQVSISQIRDNIRDNREDVLKISLSSPAHKDVEFKKIIIRPIVIKNEPYWQAEQFKDNKVFHANLSSKEIDLWIEQLAIKYVQICIFFAGKTITYSALKNGLYKEKTSTNLMKSNTAPMQNNRQKDYILKEGENIPALVDLGVFTKEFKVVSNKYDKYKQINRFVELIDDAYSNYPKSEITILDFGCGKSYLTFIIYYYFVQIKKVNATIIGYDLKKDVVDNCNATAKKYGYTNLQFVVSDVSKDVLYDKHIDMIVSLHACDTATDYALYYGIQKKVNNIFSVPCCQHEVNSSIKKGGELDIFLKYGLIKERMSALLTDSIRALILEDMGYSVDMIEFVDFEHSPKNLMIRAKKTRTRTSKNLPIIKDIIAKYQIKQKLYELTKSSPKQ